MDPNKTYRFLLFAPETEGMEEIEKELVTQFGKIERSATVKDAYDKIMGGGVDCFILSLKSFESKNLEIIVKLKSLDNDLAIIVLAKSIEEEAMKKSANMKKVVLLQRPLKEAKIISQFCQKILGGQELFNRKHARFRTSQRATIEKPETSESLPGQLYNVSKGGAYIEFEVDKVSLKPKDIVRLVIHLDKISKSHVIHCEVAWCSPYGTVTGKPGAGLQFVNPNDVYEYFLDKMKI